MTHTQTQGADGAGTFDHEFKSAPSVFYPAARGEKMFEYRRDDRGGYEVGQTVRLRCYDAGSATYLPEPPLDRRITNILRGGEFELPQGYCILSLAPLADGAGTMTAGEEPRIFKDGDAWCCLLGENLQDGIAGFGKTPDAARRNFRESLTGNLCSVLRGALTVADENLREIARDVTGADWLLEQEAEGRGPLAVIKRALELFPAPAATPGAPDSLREAFAAATDSPVFVHDFADPAVSSAPGCQDVSLSFVTPDHITAAFMGNGLAGTIDQARKDAVALAAAWNHVRALIAAQPAGQASDAGAGKRLTRAELEPHITSLILWLMERGGLGQWAADIAAKRLLLSEDSPLCLKPAANSTRTGAAETEDCPDVAYQRGKEDGYSEGVLDAAARAGLTLEYGVSSDPERHVPGPVEMLQRIAEHTDALAARPEVPSDAGWSFDMEAAPRDGTPINVGRDNGCGWDLLVVWWSKSATEYPWHTEGGGEYPEHRFDCWATLTPPSDPAPSRQAEG